MAKRRQSRPGRWATVTAVIVVASASYVMLSPDETARESAAPGARSGAGDIPLAMLGEPSSGELNSSADSANRVSPGRLAADQAASNSAIDFSRGLELFKLAQTRKDSLDARTQLNRALLVGLPPAQRREARERLAELAEEMIFGSRRIKGDPLVAGYVIKSGEVLVDIAKRHKVTAQLLAKINNLKDVNRIRAGQNIKLIEGPFHVEIHKSTHEMFLYLQDTFVRRFQVGLGEDGSTPVGVWKIKNKLTNPTYYPPRGGKIVLADDPENPLGERWIGLEGLEGEAAGQERYGIHGTNDPDSIGTNQSLGCVRLLNEDVEWVYDVLVMKHSRVTIKD